MDMTEPDKDELVECPDCGREGVRARIEKLPCPHVGLEHRILSTRGPLADALWPSPYWIAVPDSVSL